MKLSILTLAMLLSLFSCGKNNESGKSNISGTSEYSQQEELSIRQDFYNKGTELLRIYEDQMKRVLGPRTVGLIRNRLKYDNIQVTTRYLYDDSNRYVRSYHRDSYLELYIGRDQRDLDWGRARSTNRFDRLVMHELLIMGGVADTNFFYTDRIMNMR